MNDLSSYGYVTVLSVLDNNPPVLTYFSVPASIDCTTSAAYVSFQLGATDYIGVLQAIVRAVSPSGIDSISSNAYLLNGTNVFRCTKDLLEARNID